MAAFRHLLLALAWVAVQACAATLDTTPEGLIERAQLLRDARDLPWDASTGRLGNLRHVHLVAPDCTVRVISGPENRVYRGRSGVRVAEAPRLPERDGGGRPVARDLTITADPRADASAIPRVGDAQGPACFTLQLATAHDLTVQGDRLAVLFDRIELPALTLFLNPGAGLKLWFHDVRVGLLGVESNAWAAAGGTGQVDWLQLRSSQKSTALLFHDLDARHVGVSATTPGPRFSIRIGPQTDAVYYQPARAPGRLAQLYPIWIDGPVAALKVPAGQVDPLPLGAAQRQEARELGAEVLRRAGPMPALPPADAAPFARKAAEPVSPRQRVSDVLQPFLPPGVTLARVELWKAGAALEGRAPGEAAVRQFMQQLVLSGEVRSPQLAFVRPDSQEVVYRVLVSFPCAAPGERSVCLPAADGAYTEQQVQTALRPVLGPQVTDARIALRGGIVELEGHASEAESRAALQRIATQLPWLQVSTSITGRNAFRAELRMVCTVPPRGGICVVQGEPAR
jgi:hypothetical protein